MFASQGGVCACARGCVMRGFNGMKGGSGDSPDNLVNVDNLQSDG